MVFRAVWPIARMINCMFFSARYENREKLSGISRAVLVSNHTTFLDPVLISGAVSPERMWHTLLEETVLAPYLGTFIRLLGGIPIPRSKEGFQRLLKACRTALCYRRFVHFYPEGECYLYSQKLEEFKPGAFLISAELDIPVVPMATVFSDGRFKPYSIFGRVWPKEKLVILDPVYPSEYVRRNSDGSIRMDSVHQYADAVRKLIQDAIDERHGSSSFYRGRLERLKGING